MNAVAVAILDSKFDTPKYEDLKDKRREYAKKMINRGQQIPLYKMLTSKQIMNLEIKQHVVWRFKERFEKLYDIEIENEIRKALQVNAMIVDNGHSNRWIVFAKGFILVMDEDRIYTVYDCNGNDRSNILDPTKSKLKSIEKRTRHMDKWKNLFNSIDNPSYSY